MTDTKVDESALLSVSGNISETSFSDSDLCDITVNDDNNADHQADSAKSGRLLSKINFNTRDELSKSIQALCDRWIKRVRAEAVTMSSHFNTDDLVCICVFVAPMAALFLLHAFFRHILTDSSDMKDEAYSVWAEGSLETDLSNWMTDLFLNCLGYLSILIPGYCLLIYIRSQVAKRPSGSSLAGVCNPLLRLYAFGSTSSTSLESCSSPTRPSTAQSLPQMSVDDRLDSIPARLALCSFFKNIDEQNFVILHLLMCFFGLQAAYLTWGVLQERIMTRAYSDGLGEVRYFTDAQFLVFVNRVLAFVLALAYVLLTKQSRQQAPIYKFSFCSMSNIFSSWCQYEALKFVIFPVQVLVKASKIIPFMIMGRIVSKKTYTTSEYQSAGLISVGMFIFLLSSHQPGSHGELHTYGRHHSQDADVSIYKFVSGFVLMAGYIVCDSFTSTYQSKLFTEYPNMSAVQMMMSVNMLSVLLTSVSLFQAHSFGRAMAFMSQFDGFGIDCLILSICSAIGQIIIFHTISEFGPIAFVIMMTIRQAVAILLSSFIYDHPLGGISIVGLSVFFVGIGCNIYQRHQRQTAKEAAGEDGSLIAKKDDKATAKAPSPDR